MKRQLGTIVEVINPALKRLGEKEITFGLSYDLNRALLPFREEEKRFTEAKDKIVEKYGEVDPSNGVMTVREDSPKIRDAAKDLNDLMNLEVDIEPTKQFPIALFMDIKISMKDLEILDFLFLPPDEAPTT